MTDQKPNSISSQKAEATVRTLQLIAKLIKCPLKAILSSSFLNEMDAQTPIGTLRVRHDVKLTGRCWLAPRHKGIVTTIKVPANTLVVIRFDKKHADVEIPTTKGEPLILTITPQEWREKSGWFEEILTRDAAEQGAAAQEDEEHGREERRAARAAKRSRKRFGARGRASHRPRTNTGASPLSRPPGRGDGTGDKEGGGGETGG